MKKKLCENCIFQDKCYMLAYGSDRYPSTLPKYLNIIRRRDWCVNNDKCDFTKDRRKEERRK